MKKTKTLMVDNIKMDLRESGRGIIVAIELAQDKD
jgi:hypothetical protein